jgi:hypothetical protein
MLKFSIVERKLPSVPDSDDPAVQTWRDYAGRVCACACSINGERWIHIPGLASYLFDRSKREVVAFRHQNASDRRISETYFRIVVPIALHAMGTDVLHASAILTPAGVAAFCAISETGKSTTAFALAERGYPHWADDAVPFEIGESTVHALPLSFMVRLHDDAQEYFRKNNATDSLAKVGNWNSVGAEEVPLAILFILKRVQEEDHPQVKAVRLSAVDAFRTILLHAHFFNLKDRELKRQMVTHYSRLTSLVPAFEVRFKPGFEKLPLLLDEIENVLAVFSLSRQ